MRTRIPIVLACAALLAVACQDTPSEPIEQPVATAPAFNFMNGPEEAGVVVRYESGHAFFDIFEETPQDEPWVVWLGIAPDEAPALCGGAGFTTPWDVQSVASQQGQQTIIHEMNKNAGVTAFLFSEFFGNYMIGGPVYAFCNSAVIAAGTANGRINLTPSGRYVRFNGTVDWMGETYNLLFRLMFPAGEGMPVRVVRRIW
jgi:hypothetical protein